MVLKKVGDVKDLAVDDNPAVVLLVVFTNLFYGVLALSLTLGLGLGWGELLLLELSGSAVSLLRGCTLSRRVLGLRLRLGLGLRLRVCLLNIASGIGP